MRHAPRSSHTIHVQMSTAFLGSASPVVYPHLMVPFVSLLCFLAEGVGVVLPLHVAGGILHFFLSSWWL